MKQIGSLIAGVFFVAILVGCSSQQKIRVGDMSYEIGEYYKAIDRYKDGYKDVKDLKKKAEIALNIAECYRKLGQYNRSVIWYRNALRRGHADDIILLKYADALRSSQKYDDAMEMYRAYLDSVPDNKAALNGMLSCQNTPEWLKNESRFRIQIERNLNSSQSDYCAVYAGKDNEVIFTSTRKEATNRRKSNITGEKFADLFHSVYEIQKQKWSIPELLDENLIINTSAEEGAPSINTKGDIIYFTRCSYDGTKDSGAEVYQANQSRGEWTEPERLGILSDSMVVAHPSISPDGQTLYFVSDCPGSYGGMDIWKSQKNGSSWGKPINLGGEINTPGNETFPFVRNENEIYFSSDFHPGMGGLDIFKAEKEEEGEWQVENMKAPVNSQGDDFGISFLKDEDRGFFTSNRKGSRGDDIYSFILPPKIYKVTGEVFNSETERREKNVTVRIIGTDGTMVKMRSSDGRFQMNLKEDTEYIFAAFKEGFLNAKQLAATIGFDDGKTFDVALKITPTDAPIKVDNINYEFGKWELLTESKFALDSLVMILEQNPTITIELMSHTDHVGSEQFNFDLSQKRAQSVVDYLIAKGIASDRLVAKGYGETWPKQVNRKIAREYDFLKRRDELTEAFIEALETEEQKEQAKALNRRTEFRVLSTDYQETFKQELKE